MATKSSPPFNPKIFLTQVGKGKTILSCRKNHVLFSPGDAADTVYYIIAGTISLTVVSPQGKEAVVATLGDTAFFGESCLTGQALRLEAATTLSVAKIVCIDKQVMIQALRDEPTFSSLFLQHLLTRNKRVQEDLVDQLFNSAEKRLARVLLLLAQFEKEGEPEAVIAKISQKRLAEMIGTTRSRVGHFMRKFRKLDFIEYNDGLHVHSSLINVLLKD